MNPRIQLKTITPPLLITLALPCFGLLLRAQAVVPPPDGGYPNFTTAEGTKALQSLTTGSANTAVGWLSLFSTATGSFNTATGAGSLLFNTADANTAFGAAALLFNTAGINNTAVGAAALLHNTIAEENTATGAFALSSNTEGDFNTANGVQALFSNTTGVQNTATGNGALFANTTGSGNTADGVGALQGNTTGVANTAVGHFALFNNDVVGNGNTAVGAQALEGNTNGSGNTAVGHLALSNTTGNINTAVGAAALTNSTGESNIALGDQAGVNLTSGSNNIYISHQGYPTQNNSINIGKFGTHTATFIAGIYGASTLSGIPVYIDASGQLGTVSSSRRFKEAIKSMDNASKAIHALKPVTFHYKTDATSTPQFGLIAEEVAEVNPDLVVRDENGDIYTVRYEAVNAMLLNEFLKEHTKGEQQDRKIEELEAIVARLESVLKEQAAQIQKIETNGRTTQIVAAR